MSSVTQRLERLILSSAKLRPEATLTEVLQWIADSARELLEARYAAIGMLGPDNRTLESFTTSGIDEAERARIGQLPVGKGLLGVVIREAHPLRVHDIMSHSDAAGFPPHHPVMHSFLAVPVVGAHGVLGNLYVTEKIGADDFSEEDEHLALLLAERARGAVEGARAFAEINRLVSEVQDLQRARERFFAMVNHELRNSLAAVLGWAEMLVRKKDPETLPRAAFEVLEAAESSAALISDLLDLSRLDEDRLRPTLRLVDCGAVVRRAVGKVTPNAQAKSVQIEVGYPSETLTCTTDAHRVEQILVNLLTNAIRHTPDSSTIHLDIRQTEGEIQIGVADQGPGIPDENLERVFDLYFAKAGPSGQGLGLGLPLSRRLARLLGGELTAANRAQGGAALTLRLPLGAPLTLG